MSNYFLTTSSAFFMAPAIYGLYKGRRVLPFVSVITSAVSMKYWLNPSSIEWRVLDLITSKASGVIYFYYGYKMLPATSIRMIGYGNLSLILLFYQLSCSLYSNNNPHWVFAHIAFHCFTTLGQFIVLR
jgi:hypothetical protein